MLNGPHGVRISDKHWYRTYSILQNIYGISLGRGNHSNSVNYSLIERTIISWAETLKTGAHSLEMEAGP